MTDNEDVTVDYELKMTILEQEIENLKKERELTTIIAHELNNPLNNIGLFVGNAIGLIEQGGADPQHVLQELQLAIQQVFKATEIITHLRTFGRAATAKYESVAINQVIQSAIFLMREQLRQRQIEVELHFPPEDVLVTGNAIQLEQVFLNLLTNARDAMADTQHKVITIDCTVKQDTVEIRFSDTGAGIPLGLEQRIFDPFFTTKDVDSGTGLGLSITYGIIKEHQGTITAENQLGQGAVFFLQFPLQRA